MVLKLSRLLYSPVSMFENDVKMYGTQAVYVLIRWYVKFENDVKMYGTQAVRII